MIRAHHSLAQGEHPRLLLKGENSDQDSCGMYPWGLGKEQSQILSPNKPGLDARPCPWGLGKMPVPPAVCSLSWRAVYLSLGHRQLLGLCLESHTDLQGHKSSLVCSQSLTEPPCLSLITGDQHQLTGTGEPQMGTSVAFFHLPWSSSPWSRAMQRSHWLWNK